MAFTKVTGPGIHTLSNIISHNIDSSGIITATKFVGTFEGSTTGDLVTNDWITHEGDTNTRIGFPDNDKVEMQAAGKTALHVNTVGLVGINTNSPTAAHLDIATTSGTYDNLRLRRTSSGGGDSNWSLKPYAGHLYFRQGGSSTDKIVFESGGKIGLNTMTVGDTLHIHQLNANHGIKLERGGATNPGSSTIQVHSHGALSVTSSNNITHTSGGSQQHVWMQGSNEAMRIDENRRLGIGTDNPSNALDVQGGTTNTAIVARSTDAKAQISLLDNSTTSVGSVVIGAEGDDLFLTSGSGGAEALRITSNGDMGLGCTNPGADPAIGNDATVFEIRQTTSGNITSGNNRKGAVLRLKHEAQWENGYQNSSPNDDLGRVEFVTGDGSVGEGVRSTIRCRNLQYFNSQALTFEVATANSTSLEERLRITSNGKLLVGTTTEGSSGVDNLILYRNGNGGITIRNNANQNGNIFFSRGTSGTDEYKGYIQYQHAQDRMVFGTGHDERFRINSDGEVFIGNSTANDTTDRSTLLSISGAYQDPTGVWTQMCLYSSDSYAAGKGGSIGFGGQDGSTTKQQFAAIKGAKESTVSGNYAGYMAFYTRPSGAVSQERLRIRSDGSVNVNCGGNSNGLELNVGSNAGSLVFNRNGHITSFVRASDGNSNVAGGSGGGSRLYLNKNEIYMYTFPSTSAVGDEPQFQQRFRIDTSGNFHGSSSSNISDQRLKKDIATITNPLTKIKELTGRTFKWKEDSTKFDNKTKYGFVAQEVETILPDLVDTEHGIIFFDKDDKVIYDEDAAVSRSKAVNETGVIPIAVEALKELIAKVETLESKVAALESS